MLCAASISTWAQSHISITTDQSGYKKLTINKCVTTSQEHFGHYCNHSLADILKGAGITSNDRYGIVTINLDEQRNKVSESVPNLNAYTLNLRGVTSLSSWKKIKNQYVSNVLFQYNNGFGMLDNSVVENFNSEKLYNVITVVACTACQKADIDAYVNKPGYLANGLQFISELIKGYRSSKEWWSKGTLDPGNGYDYYTEYFKEVTLSGYVFARDIMSGYEVNLTPEGHLPPFSREEEYQNAYKYRKGNKCTNPLAPSYSDKNAIYISEPGLNYNAGNIGAMLGSHVYKFDFTNAQFGEWVEENDKKVFKYYPADMTLSMIQPFTTGRNARGEALSVEWLYLPTSPTQYIIPEGFLINSVYVRELCIPANYTEIDRFAFLNDKKGITHYTTTAAKDGEMLGIKKGELIDNGDSTLTLPSTMKFIGTGAFSGYGGAALLQDVYVLAEEAPVCEFYAFDQKTYVGQDSHEQGHLIKKGNYVNLRNGMAMLHFPNTVGKDGTMNQKEMLNYSDMTRKYRLYDETGKFDNVGNILVWPTQAQYNRSFNQALAGVTWFAWKENIPEQENPTGKDDPERAFSGGSYYQESWIAGCGDEKANHKAMFTMAAKNDGFSDLFTTSFDDDNPNSSFDPVGGKGHTFQNNSIDMGYWDSKLKAKADIGEDQSARPLSYDFVKYGGWHQFTIAELYDFMLEKPGPNPDKKDYFNFAKYNKNIWYTICFPFNLTKAQLKKAFGNEEEYPVLATLSSVRRDANSANITVVMSKNLLNNKLVYGEGKYANTVKYKNFKPDYVPVSYGDDDIVVEANKPYFILPCLPEEEIVKAAALGKNYNRKSEITVVKQEEGNEKVMFPVPTHVHAVKETYDAYVNDKDEAVKDTTLAFNYYFVGNYIPQTMPENVYYLNEYQKKNGNYWSSFYRNSPQKDGLMWDSYDAIIVAKIDDRGGLGSRSKGEISVQEQKYDDKDAGKTHNYIWNIDAYDDWVFCAETAHQTYAKSAFGMQLGDNYTTTIQLPDDFMIPEESKVYNLNGQFVGVDADNMSKGVYVVGGKKVVVK